MGGEVTMRHCLPALAAPLVRREPADKRVAQVGGLSLHLMKPLLVCCLRGV